MPPPLVRIASRFPGGESSRPRVSAQSNNSRRSRDPQNAGATERGVVDRVRTGERAGVGRGGFRALRHAAGFHHHDRLDPRGGAHGLPIAHVHREGLAIRAGALDAAVAVQCRTDGERVPGAVRKPGASAGFHAPGARHARERIQHPDLERVTFEDERVRIVQAAQRSSGSFLRQLELSRHVGEARCLAGLDEPAVEEVADAEVEFVHQ